jgi:hypothetical protein
MHLESLPSTVLRDPFFNNTVRSQKTTTNYGKLEKQGSFYDNKGPDRSSKEELITYTVDAFNN